MTDTRVPTTPAPEPPAAPPVPEPTPETVPAAEQRPDADTEVDYKAELEQTRAKLAAAEQTARTHRDKARRYDEHQAAQQSETERAAARAEAAEQQVAQLRRRAVDAEIRAAATGWADASDAPLYLPERDRYVDPDGEIDTAAITADLAAVLERRPHLARPDGLAAGFRRPAPDPSQGARPGGVAGLDAQITEAQQAGDWARSTALKAQRALELGRPPHSTP